MTTSAKLGLLLGLAACGTGANHTGTDTAASTRPAPAFAAKLLACQHQLDAQNELGVHAHILESLRALADAIAAVAPDRTREIEQVRTSSNALERQVATPSAHADFVKISLSAASDAFAANVPTTGKVGEYKAALAQMDAAIAKIDPNAELRTQYPHVKTAMRAAVRVVFAAEGRSEPTIARR